MNVVITGAEGQLGTSLKKLTDSYESLNPLYIDYRELDLTDGNAVEKFFDTHPCDILINCAAYTAVDKAESDRERAEAINSTALEYIGTSAAKHGFKVIHISTDYVFDGDSSSPYTEDQRPNPKTVYGETKLRGESALLSKRPGSVIIRTAWLYSPFGHNFFLTMRNKALQGEAVRVVNDQKGSPTNAFDLAKAILEISIAKDWKPGIYHYSNEGEATWYDFAKEIYCLQGADTSLVSPVNSDEYPSAARRPSYSLLDKTKIRNQYKVQTPDWRESLKKLTEYGTE